MTGRVQHKAANSPGAQASRESRPPAGADGASAISVIADMPIVDSDAALGLDRAKRRDKADKSLLHRYKPAGLPGAQGSTAPGPPAEAVGFPQS